MRPDLRADKRRPAHGRSADVTVLSAQATSGLIQDNWKVRPNLTINLGCAMTFTPPRKREPSHKFIIEPGTASAVAWSQSISLERIRTTCTALRIRLQPQRAVSLRGVLSLLQPHPNVMFTNTRGNPRTLRVSKSVRNGASDFSTPRGRSDSIRVGAATRKQFQSIQRARALIR